jgi:hypothetical protein
MAGAGSKRMGGGGIKPGAPPTPMAGKPPMAPPAPRAPMMKPPGMGAGAPPPMPGGAAGAPPSGPPPAPAGGMGGSGGFKKGGSVGIGSAQVKPRSGGGKGKYT